LKSGSLGSNQARFFPLIHDKQDHIPSNKKKFSHLLGKFYTKDTEAFFKDLLNEDFCVHFFLALLASLSYQRIFMKNLKYFLCVFYLILSPLHADKKTVCLNMIVKDESKIIERCLESTLPLIDYWVIVDTGSTDGTQEVIKKFMKEKNIPGELIERPWKNFAHNRNEAITLAKNKSDYLLFIDADDYFSLDENFKLPDLDKDYYYINIIYGGMKYSRIHVVNTALDWQYLGVLHEVLCPDASRSCGTLNNISNIITRDGARVKDPERYKKDAEILEMALQEEPDSTRYRFYLAQSYRDSSQLEKALENYEKSIRNRRLKRGTT
jgi:tetratricopeptide (TPR) repeat protein